MPLWDIAKGHVGGSDQQGSLKRSFVETCAGFDSRCFHVAARSGALMRSSPKDCRRGSQMAPKWHLGKWSQRLKAAHMCQWGSLFLAFGAVEGGPFEAWCVDFGVPEGSPNGLELCNPLYPCSEQNTRNYWFHPSELLAHVRDDLVSNEGSNSGGAEYHHRG